MAIQYAFTRSVRLREPGRPAAERLAPRRFPPADLIQLTVWIDIKVGQISD